MIAFARTLIRRWEGLIKRHGTRAVFIARLVPLARTFPSLPAGPPRAPLTPFIALTTLGCALSALGFVLVVVLAGSAWTTVDSLLGRVLLAGGLLVLAATLLRRRQHR